jgi:Na+-driven multidrug efflux pump
LVKYNLVTVAIVSVVWVLIVTSIPTGLVKLFMTPNDEVLRIAPEIIRVYGLSFFLLPFNVYATYYFQSTLQPFVSFMVSLLRGALLSGGLILLLPVSFGGSAIWWAMPLSELLTSVYVVIMMNKTRKNTLRLSTFAD